MLSVAHMKPSVMTGETPSAPMLVPLMSTAQRVEYLAGIAVWLDGTHLLLGLVAQSSALCGA